MDERELLGLTLTEALERLGREGVRPTVEWTASPRAVQKPRAVREPRVVRVRGGRLTVACFPGPARAEEV